MTLLTQAEDTEAADRIVRNGLATTGDLIVSGSSGKMFRVERLLKGGVNYSATDEDGRGWKVRVSHAKAAPAGATWGGPSVSREQERVAAAAEFSVGDIVEMARERDKAKFPGRYLVTKRTAPTRFKLVGVGTGIELTSPATLIKKV